MTILAPITLFVYNRPVPTRQTVEALQENLLAKDSDLIIYSAKKPEAAEAVREVREYVRTISGFRTVGIVERGSNWGLPTPSLIASPDIVAPHGIAVE